MAPRFALLRRIIASISLAFVLVSCSSLQITLPTPAYRTPQMTLTPTNVPTPTIIVPTPVPSLPVPGSFQEAPGLHELVRTGALESLQSRLPAKPKVVPPVERVGTYGGTWRMVIQPAADEALFLRTVAYEPLFRWTLDWSGVEPNLIDSYEVNRNATLYTFTLRKGIRWSDGQPFTTADIRFWYNDVLNNDELTPIKPFWLRSGTRLAEFAFPDAYTFTVKFSAPNSLFLMRLATPDAMMITAYPAHYARTFHKGYANSARILNLVREGGYKSWADMFVAKVGVNALDNGNFVDPNRPRLSAWVLKTPYTAGVQSVTWERNPYYWKVDPQGNQLPYIDTVSFKVVSSVDETVMQAMEGQIDMQSISSISPSVWSSITTQGDETRTYELDDGSNNVMVIHFNLATSDAVKREIFQNSDFRTGLSLAINRQEIIDQLYAGDGTPWQAAPRKESVLYDEQMAVQYTEYDVEKANTVLDRSGYKKDVFGKRLGPDGQPISFVIYVPDNAPDQIAMLSMIARYWLAVGVDIQPKAVPLPIFLATVRSNLHDAAVSKGGSTFFYDILLDPSNYVPINENTYWAVTWANWFNKVPGYEREAVLLSARNGMSTYDRARTTTNIYEHRRLLVQVLTLARTNLYTIGIALGPERYGIVQSNFHNVPERMPSAWLFPDPGPANPEQFYIQ